MLGLLLVLLHRWAVSWICLSWRISRIRPTERAAHESGRSGPPEASAAARYCRDSWPPVREWLDRTRSAPADWTNPLLSEFSLWAGSPSACPPHADCAPRGAAP